MKIQFNSSSTDLVITGISDSNIISESPLSAFPNPSSDGVFYLDKNSNYVVYNSIGELVASDFGNRVDISDKSSGVYFVKVKNETLKLTVLK